MTSATSAQVNSGIDLHIRHLEAEGFSLQVDCTLPARGVTAIYGPSGSGKTTLLDCIAGLRRPSADSDIRLGERVYQAGKQFAAPWERRVGYVFQDARLFPHLNVEQNLLYALRRNRGSNKLQLSQAVEWLELSALLQQSSTSLSAGQSQRVAIARALLSGPELLLLDEPLANLDHAASQHCLRLLQQLAAGLDIPMLYVSHDIEEISQIGDYLLLIEAGRVSDHGPLLELCNQLDSRLSREEQAAAIAVATLSRHDTDFGLSELELEGQTLLIGHMDLAVGQKCRLRIPARDVSVCRQRPADSSILNILPVTLCEMADTGDARTLLRLRIGSQYLLARITRKSAHQLQLQTGDTLFAQIKTAALLTGISNRE